MKIHITNIYNFKMDDQLVKTQQYIAKVGRDIGFHEMGIFSYPVETDTSSELSKRLDGVISALEDEDVVIMQLPTENGYEYEQLLFRKIKAYRGTKIALLFHEMNQYEEMQKYDFLCENADFVIASKNIDWDRIHMEEKEKGFSFKNIYSKKVLIDIVYELSEHGM